MPQTDLIIRVPLGDTPELRSLDEYRDLLQQCGNGLADRCEVIGVSFGNTKMSLVTDTDDLLEDVAHKHRISEGRAKVRAQKLASRKQCSLDDALRELLK